MSLLYCAADFFIEALLKTTDFTQSYGNLKSLRKFLSKEVSDFLEKESKKEFLYIFRKFPDVFTINEDSVVLTYPFLSLYTYENSVKHIEAITSECLENIAVLYFSKILRVYGPQHYVTLFSTLAQDKTQPYAHYFSTSTVTDAYTFFQIHSDIFIFINELVSLNGHLPNVRNHLLSEKLNVVTMPRLKDSVLFLLSCFKSIHYIELKQCISYVITNAKDILEQYSLIKQREFFENMPYSKMDEYGYLGSLCTIAVNSIDQATKIILLTVCFLACKKIMHFLEIVKNIGYRMQLDAAMSYFYNLSPTEQLSFFQKYPGYFHVSQDGYVTLLPSFFLIECIFNKSSKEFSVSSPANNNIQLPTADHLETQNYNSYHASNNSSDVLIQTAKYSVAITNYESFFEIPTLSGEVNRLIANSVLFLSKYFQPLDKAQTLTTLLHVLENVQITFQNLPTTDKVNFVMQCCQFINAILNPKVELDTSFKLEESKSLLLFITYNLTQNNSKRIHFEKIVKSLKMNSVNCGLASSSISKQFSYFRGMSKYFEMKGDGFVSLAQSFHDLSSTINFYSSFFNAEHCSSKSSLLEDSNEKTNNPEVKTLNITNKKPVALDENNEVLFNCSEKVNRLIDLASPILVKDKVPLYIYKTLLTWVHLLKKHTDKVSPKSGIKAPLLALKNLYNFFCGLPKIEQHTFVNSCREFIKWVKRLQNELLLDDYYVVPISKQEMENLFIIDQVLSSKRCTIQTIIIKLKTWNIDFSMSAVNPSALHKYFKETSEYFMINSHGYVSLKTSFDSVLFIIDSVPQTSKKIKNKSESSVVEETNSDNCQSMSVNNMNQMSTALAVDGELSSETSKKVTELLNFASPYLIEEEVPTIIYKILLTSIHLIKRHTRDLATNNVIKASLLSVTDLYDFFCNLSAGDQLAFVENCYQFIMKIRTQELSNDGYCVFPISYKEEDILFIMYAHFLEGKDSNVQKIINRLKKWGVGDSLCALHFSNQCLYFKEASKYFMLNTGGCVTLKPSFDSLIYVIDSVISPYYSKMKKLDDEGTQAVDYQFAFSNDTNQKLVDPVVKDEESGKISEEVKTILDFSSNFQVEDKMLVTINKFLLTSAHLFKKHVGFVPTKNVIKASVIALTYLHDYFSNLSEVDRHAFLEHCYQFTKNVKTFYGEHRFQGELPHGDYCIVPISKKEKDALFIIFAHFYVGKDSGVENIISQLKKWGVAGSLCSLTFSNQVKYFKETTEYFMINSDGFVTLRSSFDNLISSVDSALSSANNTKCELTPSDRCQLSALNMNKKSIVVTKNVEEFGKTSEEISKILNLASPLLEVPVIILKILLTTCHLFKKHTRSIHFRIIKASIFALSDLYNYFSNLSTVDQHAFVGNCYWFIKDIRIDSTALLHDDYCVVPISSEEMDILFIIDILLIGNKRANIPTIIKKLKNWGVSGLLTLQNESIQYRYFETSEYFQIDNIGYVTLKPHFDHLICIINSAIKFNQIKRNVKYSNWSVPNKSNNDRYQLQNISGDLDAKNVVIDFCLYILSFSKELPIDKLCHRLQSCSVQNVRNFFSFFTISEKLDFFNSFPEYFEISRGNFVSLKKNVSETYVPKTDLNLSELLNYNSSASEESESRDGSAVSTGASELSLPPSNLPKRKKKLEKSIRKYQSLTYTSKASKVEKTKKSSKSKSGATSECDKLSNNIVKSRMFVNSSQKLKADKNTSTLSSKQSINVAPSTSASLSEGSESRGGSAVSTGTSEFSLPPSNLPKRKKKLEKSIRKYQSLTYTSKASKVEKTIKSSKSKSGATSECDKLSNNIVKSRMFVNSSQKLNTDKNTTLSSEQSFNDTPSTTVSKSVNSTDVSEWPEHKVDSLRSGRGVQNMFENGSNATNSKPKISEKSTGSETNSLNKSTLHCNSDWNFTCNAINDSKNASEPKISVEKELDFETDRSKMYWATESNTVSFTNISCSENKKKCLEFSNSLDVAEDTFNCDTSKCDASHEAHISELMDSFLRNSWIESSEMNTSSLKPSQDSLSQNVPGNKDINSSYALPNVQTSNHSEKSTLLEISSDTVAELRAVNFFCIILGNYENYSCGISVEFLKEHLPMASSEVQTVMNNMYGNDFLPFFQKHKKEFCVSPDCRILLQKKSD